MPNVDCPDPRQAPPRPTTTTSTLAPTTTVGSTIDLFLMDDLFTDSTDPTTRTTKAGNVKVGKSLEKPPASSLTLPAGMKLSEIAGRSKGRPGTYSQLSIYRTRIYRILRSSKRLSESKLHLHCFLQT